MSKVGGTRLCEGGMPLPPGVGLGKPGPGCLCYAFINSERREFLGPYKTPEFIFVDCLYCASSGMSLHVVASWSARQNYAREF